MREDLTEDQRGLADFISMISEELYCAGWRSGIEFELWGYLVNPGAPIPHWNRRPNSGLLKLLGYASKMVDGWVRHDDTLERVFVPLDEWLRLYAEHQERNATDAATVSLQPAVTFEEMLAEWDKDPLDIEEWRQIASPAIPAPRAKDVRPSLFSQGLVVTEQNWSEVNDRRIELIDKDVDGLITADEKLELELLENAARDYVQATPVMRYISTEASTARLAPIKAAIRASLPTEAELDDLAQWVQDSAEAVRARREFLESGLPAIPAKELLAELEALRTATGSDTYYAQHWSDRQVERPVEAHYLRPIELIRNGDCEALLTVEEAISLVGSLQEALAEEASRSASPSGSAGRSLSETVERIGFEVIPSPGSAKAMAAGCECILRVDASIRIPEDCPLHGSEALSRSLVIRNRQSD